MAFEKLKVRHLCASHQWRWRESNPRPKDSPTDIYKLSRAIWISPAEAPPNRVTRQLAASRWLGLSPDTRQIGWHSGLCNTGDARRRRGSRSVGLYSERPALAHPRLCRKRHGRISKIASRYFGSYCFCAELTGTAPPGLQPVTSLLRRSLSSPVCSLL